MDVKIISTEIIKPSSPTPPHLKTYKLSLLDQFNIDGCYPMMLLYEGSILNTTKTSDHLKKSLAQTLTYYYPYAGRLIDSFSIDCDDSGAPFIQAHIPNTMSHILQRLDFDVLAQLLPFKNDRIKVRTNNNIIVVQLNYFACGGVAIAILFKHVIADGPASTNFIKTWSEIASGASAGADIKDVVFDVTSVFPPQDLPLQHLWRNCFQVNVPLGEAVVKRFTFDRTKMDALRGGIGEQPTRFEAVTALILVAAAAAATEREDVKPTNVAVIPINLRKKINPPFPEKCVGNVGQATMVKWEMEETTEYKSVARKIRESIRKMDNDYARKLNQGEGFLNDLKKLNQEKNKMNVYFVTSVSRSPLYESDFGWGKPAWANVVLKINNFVVISDTRDGQGIEAWVGLPKREMPAFQNNPTILAYASFNPA